MKKNILFFSKLIAAIIMLETLFFKFSGAQESIHLFTEIVGEHEKYLRIGTGVIELIASILLFIPKTALLGALLTFATMSGAIITHLFIIGIVHNNDNGVLFMSAIVAFLASIVILYLSKTNKKVSKRS